MRFPMQTRISLAINAARESGVIRPSHPFKLSSVSLLAAFALTMLSGNYAAEYLRMGLVQE